MHNTPTLCDIQTLHTARVILQEHLPLKANGYTCTSQHLYDALLAAGASRQTLESVCRDLVAAPKADTVRHYLNAQLTVEALPHLQDGLNDALAARLPQRLQRTAQTLAIDFHDQPYYGKATQDEAKWIRARAKNGTTRFIRIATAYVIHRGMRLTLGLHFVLPGETTVSVLQQLLARVAALEVEIGLLLLDKGFSGIAVLQHLEHARLPAIIACPIRGKKAPEATATRALCRGRASYRLAYTFANSETSFEAPVAVCRVFTTARRTGRMQRRGTWLVFIVIGEALARLSPRQVRRLYRKRFGVETSHRLSRQVRAWTSSSNAGYRFVLIALSFFMVNVWVHLCLLFTQVPRRGGRRLDVERFRLQRYAKFIMHALERHYGCVQQIVAPAAPLL
jgi:hypothetical protein